MSKLISNRAAPLFALLVILSGIVIFIWLPPALTSTPPAIPTLRPEAVEFTLASEIQFHRSRGDLQVALYHIEVQANAEGWSNTLHEQAANLWRDMGDLAQALPHWEAIALTDPQPDNLRRLAGLYLQTGEWGVAYAYIEQLLTLAPDDEWGLYHAGVLLAPTDAQSARQYLSRVPDASIYHTDAERMLFAMQADSGNVSVRVGAVLAGMGEWTLAENAFQYAAAVNYPFAEATAYVGLMRVQQQYDGDSWMQQALALEPENPDVRFIEGLYWRALGAYDNSTNAFLTAIILDPTVPEYYAELGNTYRFAGNLGEAEYWLTIALNISDNNPIIQQSINRLREEESFVLSVSDLNFTRMARAEENDPAVISANGWVLHILGQSANGLEYVNRALNIDPDNARAQYDKARILLETGHADEAIPLLENLATGNTSFATTAQRLLDEVN